MHTVYNPSGFFDVTPYPLIHRFTLADIGFELPPVVQSRGVDARISRVRTRFTHLKTSLNSDPL